MKRALIFIITGCVLLMTAATMFLLGEKEGADAADISDSILETLENDMLSDAAESVSAYSYGETVKTVDNAKGTPPARMVNGVNVIGVISVPSVDIEVPVAADWSYASLKKTACRYSGSAEGGGLIILAHNYKRHFGNLKNAEIGDEVRFMDVNGVLYRYSITKKETLGKYELDSLTQSYDDLTLFTCTYGGGKRVTVRCEMIPQE